ncbi:hypothetical protein N183_38245 [Sinorhizobium sp. Sb3]|nr:hypothetical protein N183_38245 [Sinorhizobium sp. Sb3]
MFKVFIARANIEKFNELISKETDPEKKALFKELLTREEDK